MNDPIQSIEELENFKLEDTLWDGYRVKTRLREILVLVSAEGSCCESWGSISTPDNPQDFLGADLLDVDGVEMDEGGDVKVLSDVMGGPASEALELAFVRIKTSKGHLTLAVYNQHNGYYGHATLIRGTGPGMAKINS